jgi:hypothetical protein
VERSGFGFGVRANNTKIPVILVGANINKADEAKRIEADLFILSPDSNGAAQATPIEDSDIWGVSVSGGSGEDIEKAVEAGADFIVVQGESAPGSALLDGETGKGFVIGSNVSEERSKAIEAGPFDFLIVDGTELSLPLSVGAVLDIQEQLARYSRHIFLTMKDAPDKANLELLRDIGISALIYNAEIAANIDLSALRESIGQLEPRKPRAAGGAVLPHGADSSSQIESDDDHDHEHDDDDWE